MDVNSFCVGGRSACFWLCVLLERASCFHARVRACYSQSALSEKERQLSEAQRRAADEREQTAAATARDQALILQLQQVRVGVVMMMMVVVVMPWMCVRVAGAGGGGRRWRQRHIVLRPPRVNIQLQLQSSCSRAVHHTCILARVHACRSWATSAMVRATWRLR
jgi:hypothetical protein